MAIRLRVSTYVNNMAQAAFLYRLQSKNIGASLARPLTGKIKAGYFFLGLGYTIADVFRGSSSVHPPMKEEFGIFSGLERAVSSLPKISVAATDTGMLDHVYFSKEGTSGGRSFGAGGCGCN